MVKRGLVISLIFAVQLVGALFFVLNILASVVGFAPLNWQVSEFVELGAAVSLLIGVGLTGGAIARRVRGVHGPVV